MAHTYIGNLGLMARLRCPSSLETRYEIPGQERVTIGGSVNTQEAPRGYRSWKVGLSWASHEDLAQLEALAYRAYGPPPWSFVDPDMQITNMLLPDNTVFGRRFSYQGSVSTLKTGDGLLARVNQSPGTVNYGTCPVIPGIPVTGGVYGTGTVTVTLTFQNYAGATVSTATTTQAQSALTRVTVTGTPPEGAAQVKLSATATTQGAPSVTWTDKPTPWTIGHGVRQVTTRGLDRTVRAAAKAPWLQRADMAFEVIEIGG